MAISIDWGTKVILIPKSYLTFISGTTYQLNSDTLRLDLKDLEDDLLGGMPYLDTHRHISPVTLSGTTYSRFIEIINGYTITFEDGLYQVNISGANTNFVDVLNRNSVSVVANNSSGLISSDQLEYSSFHNRVTIDTVRGVSGVVFPIGTVRTPSNNIPDALLIAQEIGVSQLFFKNNHTIQSAIDVSGYELVGDSPEKVVLDFESGSTTLGTEIFDCQISGYLGSIASITGCHILNVVSTSNATDVELNLYNSIIDGTITLSSGLTGEFQVFNCKSGAGQTVPGIDFNGSSIDLVVRDFTGGLELKNMTSGNTGSVDMHSGQLVVNANCTDATLTVRGLCKVTNNASGNVSFTLNDESTVTATEIESIAAAVWDKLVSGHITDGSFGHHVGKKILTTGKFVALK
jgi:hypothetical protein